MGVLRNDNTNCKWFYHEPGECKKCLLMGYHYSCGSPECEKAKESINEKANTVYNPRTNCEDI